MSGLFVRLLMSCDEVTFCVELTSPMDFMPLPLVEPAAVNPMPGGNTEGSIINTIIAIT